MNRTQHGFTLIEMILVMTLVTTLSTSGLYGWHKWQQYQRLWQATQQVRGIVEQLRNDANWHNREHRLVLQKLKTGWCLASHHIAELACQQEGRWQLVQPFSDIEIVEITPGLGFYGRRNSAWPGHIRLRNPAGEWQVIVSVWGRIRICQLSGKSKCS